MFDPPDDEYGRQGGRLRMASRRERMLQTSGSCKVVNNGIALGLNPRASKASQKSIFAAIYPSRLLLASHSEFAGNTCMSEEHHLQHPNDRLQDISAGPRDLLIQSHIRQDG